MRLQFFRSRWKPSSSATALSCTLIVCCAMMGVVLTTGGCGGGGGGGSESSPSPSPSPSPSASPTVTRKTVSFDITWAGRTRGGFTASSVNSARSAIIRFYEGGVRTTTPTATVRVNRDSRSDSYTATFTTGSSTIDVARVCVVDVSFYADPDQGGAVVGAGSMESRINADTGALANAIAVFGEIKNISVIPTTAFVGEVSDLTISTTNQFGTLIPVSPGSLTLSIASGNDFLTAVAGTGPTDPVRVLGVKPGTATVTASVDGVTSPAATVGVDSRSIVSITPATATISLEKTLQLSASVSGAPTGDGQKVTWSVLTDNGGTITADGLYTAPKAEGDFLIQAQSVYNPSKKATVSVKVSSAVGVQITPINPTTGWLQTVTFTAQVANTPAGQNGVTWSVLGTDSGSINAGGVYTPPKKDGVYTITATSVYDTRKTAQTTVNVSSNTAVTITPATDVTVNVNATKQFTAAVAGVVGDSGVTWSVEPDAGGGNVGSISPTGLFTAPPKRILVYIRATSTFDTRKFARIPVQVTAGGADITVQ